MPTQIRPGRIILSPRIPVDQESGAVPVQLYVWNEGLSDWVPFTGIVGGSGGGGAGVDPVGIKDGTVASQKLAVDSNGRIGINNFPGTQPVSGSVAVSNFPSGFAVVGNVEVMNDAGNPLPVSGPLTDAQLRAAAVPVAIQAADLAALETIQVGNFPASQPVTGPLTDSQLRATAVPVSGPLTDTQLRASAVPVSGPLTDTQLRAAAVPVSLATVPSHAVTGPITNTELRATPVPISGTVAIGAGTTPTYKGRACGLRNPARVALTQPIFTFWNGSVSKICRIKYVGVDAISTAIKAATVIPALIRFYRCTAAPTNGAIITKAPEDSTLTSDANIVLRGDASADGTVAASALAATVSGGALTQEYAPRLITAAGYEMFDKASFFETQELIIRPNEGMIVRLEAPANMVATDHYIVNAIWTEE